MAITGSGHGHKVTFRSIVIRTRSVTSTPHLLPQMVSFNLSWIPDTETSGKDTDSEAEGMTNVGTRSGLTAHHQTIRRAKQDVYIMMQSLQLVIEELRKICKPKFQKLKDGYSANVMLMFNSWLKDMEMCIKEPKLIKLEAVHLIKDYKIENAGGAVAFYLDTYSTWDYHELIAHLRTSFESRPIGCQFYSRVQQPQGTQDQFASELQILSWKVINVRTT